MTTLVLCKTWVVCREVVGLSYEQKFIGNFTNLDISYKNKYSRLLFGRWTFYNNFQNKRKRPDFCFGSFLVWKPFQMPLINVMSSADNWTFTRWIDDCIAVHCMFFYCLRRFSECGTTGIIQLYWTDIGQMKYKLVLLEFCLKGKVPRDFWLQVFYMDQFPPSPW